MTETVIGRRSGRRAPAVLSLVLDVEASLGPLPLVADLAGFIAAIDALGQIAQVSTRLNIPIVEIVRSLAYADAPGTILTPDMNVDVWWSVQRVWRGPRSRVKPGSSVVCRDDLPRFDVNIRDRIRVARLTLHSPLGIVMHLPWDWFAAGGGGIAFVKAVEYWLNSVGRIRVERARLSAEQMKYEAERLEQEVRKTKALDEISLLRRTESRVVQNGQLHLPTHDGDQG